MIQSPTFDLRLARNDADILAAQRLRYQVFVQELGANGPLVDHDLKLECDQFDRVFDHLLLIDPLQPQSQSVVGVYRLLRDDKMPALGRFYSEDEFDLTALRRSGRKLLELGRSCLHPAYRGGTAMHHLWQGLGAYVRDHKIDVLFGAASFQGIDLQALRQPLSYLHAQHLAPPDLRVMARSPQFMDLMPADQIDRKQALLATPALIKAYLRLGGVVSDGVFVDRDFNTTDVCLVLDTARMATKQKSPFMRLGQGH